MFYFLCQRHKNAYDKNENECKIEKERCNTVFFKEENLLTSRIVMCLFLFYFFLLLLLKHRFFNGTCGHYKNLTLQIIFITKQLVDLLKA